MITYYSNRLSTIITTIVIAPLFYGKYKEISKYSPALGYSFIFNMATLSAHGIFQYFSKYTVVKVEEGNYYKSAISQVNLHADNHRLKETLFIAGSKHFSDRALLNEKLKLEISEGSYILSILSSILQFKNFQTISSFFMGISHNFYGKEKIENDLKNTALKEGINLS